MDVTLGKVKSSIIWMRTLLIMLLATSYFYSVGFTFTSIVGLLVGIFKCIETSLLQQWRPLPTSPEARRSVGPPRNRVHERPPLRFPDEYYNFPNDEYRHRWYEQDQECLSAMWKVGKYLGVNKGENPYCDDNKKRRD